MLRQEPEFDWLDLPERDLVEGVPVSLQYGVGEVIREYCGREESPRALSCHWQHGWLPKHMGVDPQFIAGEEISRGSGKTVLVARKDQEDYLRSNGIQSQAIGLPIVYLKNRDFIRRASTLLVMPVHSHASVVRGCDEAAYLAQYRPLAREGIEVYVCVSPECLRTGAWVNSARQHGFKLIYGAYVWDTNSLLRMRAIFSQFEFMSTNCLTSGVAYAAAFGCKVSFSNEYYSIPIQEMERSYFFQRFPGLAAKINPLRNEEHMRREFPGLFCPPQNAEARVEWGREQIGWGNRVAAKRLEQLVLSGKPGAPPASRTTVAVIKNVVREWILPPGVSGILRRLIMHRPEMSGQGTGRGGIREKVSEDHSQCQHSSIRVDGRELMCCDTKSAFEEYREVFDRRLVDFPCIYDDPLIIDIGAGVGMRSLYWFSKFRNARVVAVESGFSQCVDLLENCSDNLERMAVYGPVSLRSDKSRLVNSEGSMVADRIFGQPFGGLGLVAGELGSDTVLEAGVSLVVVDLSRNTVIGVSEVFTLLERAQLIFLRIPLARFDRKTVSDLLARLGGYGFSLRFRDIQKTRAPMWRAYREKSPSSILEIWASRQ